MGIHGSKKGLSTTSSMNSLVRMQLNTVINYLLLTVVLYEISENNVSDKKIL